MRRFSLLKTLAGLVGVATLTSCAPKPHIIFVMAASTYDLTVNLDGRDIGRLTTKDQKIEKDVSEGGHSFYLHDNSISARSQDIPFRVGRGDILTYTLGNGDIPLQWTFEDNVRLSGLRSAILSGGATVRLTVDLDISGYSGRSFAVGGFWLSQSGSTYPFVVPASACVFNPPGGFMGKLFQVKCTSDVAARYQPSFDVTATCFPIRSNGKRYYGMFRLYSAATVGDVNAPNLAQIGPPETSVFISFPLPIAAQTNPAWTSPPSDTGRVILDVSGSALVLDKRVEHSRKAFYVGLRGGKP